MATIINQRWPRDISPESCTFTRSRNDILQTSPRTRQTHMIAQGRPLWSAQLSWVLPNNSKLAKLRRWLDAIEGFKGSVLLWDFTSPRPEYVTAPTHWAQDATVTLAAYVTTGAKSISLSGLQASQIGVYEGQYIQIGRRLYVAAETQNASSAGACSVQLTTPVIEDYPAGQDVRLVEAACEMHLAVQNVDANSRAGEGLIVVSATFLESSVDFHDLDEIDIDFMRNRVRESGTETTPASFLTVSRASTAAYTDSDLVLKYASNNVLRIDHDPLTGVRLGALVEGFSGVNLTPASEDLGNTTYHVLTNLTVSANATVAPDAATTMDKLVEANDVAQSHSKHRNATGRATITAGATVCYSVFLKAAERTRCRIVLTRDTFASQVRADVNLTAKTITFLGALGSATNDTVTIKERADGSFRVSVSGVIDGSSTNAFAQIILQDASGNVTYNGDGTSGMYAWGEDLKTGQKLPSSYVPTTTTTATRNADVVSRTLGFVPTEGALYVEVAPAVLPLAGVFSGFGLNVAPAVTANSSIGFFVAPGGSVSALTRQAAPALDFATTLVAASLVPGTFYKMINVFKRGDHAHARGETLGTTADASAAPPIDTLNLHQSGSQFAGHFKRIRIKKTRPTTSDAQLLVA